MQGLISINQRQTRKLEKLLELFWMIKAKGWERLFAQNVAEMAGQMVAALNAMEPAGRKAYLN